MLRKNTNRIIFLSKYSEKGASSRYRIYQYLQYYYNIFPDIKIYPLLDDFYFHHLYNTDSKNILFKIFKAYLKRIIIVLFSNRSILFYIGGGELFPYFPSLFEKYLNFRKIKFILDYDDAIFHNYDNNKNKIIQYLLKDKIKKCIKYASCIITGSPYLTNYARKFNSNVIEIPTSIDIMGYSVKQSIGNKDKFRIGWIGSQTTSKNIIQIIPALKRILDETNSEIILIGFNKNLDIGIDCSIIKWDKNLEVEQMKCFDIGIMPLDDNLFNNGKCGFKLIQYMACGIPTIATPLEANIKIDRYKQNLFAATNDEWYSALMYAYQNKNLLIEVGKKNREVVEEYYCIQKNYLKYVSIIKGLITLS
jgi:glycosyltransferase involved in cell wall biosynthesis